MLALLTVVGLPPEGVAEHLQGFVVARDANGRLVGSAGIERYGVFGLLRSVAVGPDLQRSGLGSRLVAEVLDIAANVGVGEVVLLTLRRVISSLIGSSLRKRPALTTMRDSQRLPNGSCRGAHLPW